MPACREFSPVKTVGKIVWGLQGRGSTTFASFFSLAIAMEMEMEMEERRCREGWTRPLVHRRDRLELEPTHKKEDSLVVFRYWVSVSANIEFMAFVRLRLRLRLRLHVVSRREINAAGPQTNPIEVPSIIHHPSPIFPAHTHTHTHFQPRSTHNTQTNQRLLSLLIRLRHELRLMIFLNHPRLFKNYIKFI